MGCGPSSPASAATTPQSSPPAAAAPPAEAEAAPAVAAAPAAEAEAPAPAAEGDQPMMVPSLGIAVDFEVPPEKWLAGFDAHSDSAESEHFYGFSLGEPRSAFCDESQSAAYLSADGKEPEGGGSAFIHCGDVDMAKLGGMMGSPVFGALSVVQGQKAGPPGILQPVAPDAPPASPDIVIFAEVKEFDTWYELFKEHGDSKTIKGVEAPFTRAECCDESRTRVYRHAKESNKVAVCVYGCNEKLGVVLADAEFSKVIEEEGGVISQTAYAMVAPPMPPPPPPPPEAAVVWFDNRPMAEKMEWMEANMAEDASISFVGQYAPPMPPMSGAKFLGMGKMMTASFPDFGFEQVGDPPAPAEDGSTQALVYSKGTHSGAPFALPGKPPVGPTGVVNRFGPTLCRVYADGAKLLKVVFEPLREGPSGPPAFYVASGGDMNATVEE